MHGAVKLTMPAAAGIAGACVIIITMAKTLQIEIVAEGVETVEQATGLRDQGVQYGQGWLYSQALHKDAFIAWVADNDTVHES